MLNDYFIEMIASDIRRKVDLAQEQHKTDDQVQIVFRDKPSVVHSRIIPILDQHGMKFTSRAASKGAYGYYYTRNKFVVEIRHYSDHAEVFIWNETHAPRDTELPASIVHRA